jgi:hypothetical protein
MQVTLTRVFISDKNKQGEPLINKFGKPYKKVAIKTTEHGEAWLSSFMNGGDTTMESWKEGDTVEINVEQNGQFLNFKVPTKTDALENRVTLLEKEIKFLNSMVMGKAEATQTTQTVEPGHPDYVSPDQIPF